MSTLLTINIVNNEPATQTFFVFQQPAVYIGGATVYSNALWSGALGNSTATGGSLTFEVNKQYYAGIQQGHSTPAVGQSSGYASATRAIDLATQGSANADAVTATVVPALGLSQPVADPAVQGGAFRIYTPSFEPASIYNVGSAVELTNGSIVMSNFVVANPASYADCQPILKFYVATGTYTPGTVINFSQASQTSALCDFTGGQSVLNVTLNANGTWAPVH